MKKYIAAALAAAALAFAQPAHGGFLDGLRIPKNYDVVFFGKNSIEKSVPATQSAELDWYGRGNNNLWAYASGSATSGKANDPYAGVGFIHDSEWMSFAPTMEGRIDKHGNRMSSMPSLYATSISHDLAATFGEDDRFSVPFELEASPRVTYDVDAKRWLFGATLGTGFGDLRLGIDLYGSAKRHETPKNDVAGLLRLVVKNFFGELRIEKTKGSFKLGVFY